MPLNAKGRTIMQAMRQQYGNRAERVFYAARNAGTIGGVDRGRGWSSRAWGRRAAATAGRSEKELTNERSTLGERLRGWLREWRRKRRRRRYWRRRSSFG